MRTIKLGKSNLEVSVIGLGCMRLTERSEKEAREYLETCLELGINFFDHADIYQGGECEKLFSKAFPMSADTREKIVIQSKCGICPRKMYDFSKEHILDSVDHILQRLHTEYLDVLVLHRPDALMEPEEVAEAFDILESTGKVRHFGVSNHKPTQIELLKRCVKQEIITDQLQFSIPFSGMISSGLEVNMVTDTAADRDGSVLDYCRLHDITIQAWSPFLIGGGIKKTFIDNDAYPELNRVLLELGEKYSVSKTAVAAAWILRHPANIQVIAGTMNTGRIRDIAKASEIRLEREEWYRLYLAAGHRLP